MLLRNIHFFILPYVANMGRIFYKEQHLLGKVFRLQRIILYTGSLCEGGANYACARTQTFILCMWLNNSDKESGTAHTKSVPKILKK